MTAPPEVGRLIEWLPDDFWRAGPNVGRCIEAARICVAAWRRAGVDCKAVACDVWAFNAKGWGLANLNVAAADWPADAWSVGCDCDDRSLHTSRSDGSTSRFNGHVVIVGAGWLADVTAQQFHRPSKGIVLHGAVLAERPDDEREPVAYRADTTTVVYRLRPEMASWRLTPAWRQDLDYATLDRLVDVACGETVRP